MTRSTLFILLILLYSCNQLKNKDNSVVSDDLIVDFEKPAGKMILVSDVEIADSLLKMDTAKNIFEYKIGKEILFYPELHQHHGLVYCPNNGLIQTIQECYDNHRPLVLSPDIIWLAICQGVSMHINENYDSLKNIVFIKDKPDKIVVRNDSLEYSAKQWGSLISSFSDETRKYTKSDYYSFFVSDFSTTTDISRTAYQITLLESYKKAFEYVGETGCGIPSITITGNKEDWQNILMKLDKLKEIGLANWAENLKPIISEFIDIFDGKVNSEFWQSIYKNASEYNGFYISGWIIKFFPYIKELESEEVYDEKHEGTRNHEVFKPNMYLDGNDYMLSTLSTDNFPSGIAKIDVTWNNYFKNFTKKMEVYAGFFAIMQYSDKSLEPFISWAVCEKDGKMPGHHPVVNGDLKLKHSKDYWSPHVIGAFVDSAIYDIRRFKSHNASVDYIKKRLQDSISNNPQFKGMNLNRVKIDFIVLTNGNITRLNVSNTDKNSLLSVYINNQLLNLPEKWFPALAKSQDVLDADLPEEELDLKVRANSKVEIELFNEEKITN